MKCVECDIKNLRDLEAGYCEEHKWCYPCELKGRKVAKSTEPYDMKEYGYCPEHCQQEQQRIDGFERAELAKYGDIQDDLPSDYEAMGQRCPWWLA